MTFRRFNILESLYNEDEIRGYLEAALLECPGDTRFYSLCLADVAKARTVNQLAKETGIDRQALCDMFVEPTDGAETPMVSQDVVARVARAFQVPVPV